MAYSLPDLPAKENYGMNILYETSNHRDYKGLPNDVRTFYETTNKRDYKGLPGSPADNGRPGTSNFYSDTPTGNTKYGDEFGWKVVKRELCGRTGTASGQRKNNPHPLETFMVWKFPNKATQQHNEMMKESLLKELCEDKIRSTYQVDYVGLNQGQKTKFRHPENFITHVKKHIPPHTLSSTVRVDYQVPEYEGNLQGNTTRHGCNAQKVIPAVGVVPTVIHRSPLMNPSYDTSYTNEFANQEDDIKVSVPRLPDIQQFAKNMSVNEKAVINRMFNSGILKDGPRQIERISGWDGPSWK